jgi:hypothetical protein
MYFNLPKILTYASSYTICADFLGTYKLNQLRNYNETAILPLKFNEYVNSIPKSGVVEDKTYRSKWNYLVNNEKSYTYINPGNYSFCYRNYVNFEEKWAMTSRFSPIHRLLFKFARPTELFLMKNNTAILKDEFKILGLSLRVKWDGYYINNTIHWISTEINSRFYNRKNPSISEKQRAKPWTMTRNTAFLVLNQYGSNNSLIFVENWKKDLVQLSNH